MKICGAAALLAFAAVAPAAPIPVTIPQRAELVDFAKEIYPVLRKNCLACHNTTKAKANLNLESPQTMLKGGDGGPAIVAGNGAESLLYKASAHLDDDTAMPPKGNKVEAVALTPEQLGVLKLWIDEGAKGEAVADAKGALPWRASSAGRPVNALAFSPEARLVAAARGNRVELCEIATGRVLARLADPALENGAADRDAVMSVAFGAEDLLATGGFRTVRIWRRMARVIERDFGALPEIAVAIFIGEEGRSASVTDAKGARWRCDLAAEKFAPVPEYGADENDAREVAREHPAAWRALLAERDWQAAQSLAAARKAQFAAAAEKAKKENETARNAAPALEKARAELRRKQDEAAAAAEAARLSPEDKAALDTVKKAAEAGTKADAAFRAAKVNAELGARLAAEAAAANTAAEMAALAADAALAEAQAALDAARKAAATPLPPASRATLSPDGKTALVFDAEGRAWLVATESGALLEPPDRLGAAAFMPDGRLLCSGADRHLRIMSARRVWALERTIGNPDDPAIFADRVTTLAFSPDGKLLASGGGTPSRDGELKLWRVADGTLARAIPKTHADTINSVAFSPDGEFLATAAGDRFARVWRVGDGSRVANLEGHTGHVLCVAWRADGLALATAGADRSLRVWDFESRKQTANTADFGAEVSAVSFVGGSDALLAACGDNSLRLAGKPLPDSSGFLFTAAADPAGRWVAAGGQDGMVRVWSVAERKIARAFAGE